MKNNYPRNFINKILTKMRNKQQSNIPDEPEPSRTRITLPYINSTSEMTARLLRPFNIDVSKQHQNKPKKLCTRYLAETVHNDT